jgi:hypothetical protein
MFCDEVLELIEPIAAGELAADERVEGHIASCGQCAASLRSARRLEQLLQGRGVAKPPAQFTSRIMGRIRRDRWRREQFLDAGFNAAVGLAALTLVVALWIVFTRSGIGAAARDAIVLANSTVLDTLARRVAPSLPLYLGAFGLVAAALGVWWWAERDPL